MRFPIVVVRKDVLESWLTISECTRSRLAHELGVSKGCVSQILSSVRQPSAHLIAQLMMVTGLPFDRLFAILQSQGSSRKAPGLRRPSDSYYRQGARSRSGARVVERANQETDTR